MLNTQWLRTSRNLLQTTSSNRKITMYKNFKMDEPSSRQLRILGLHAAIPMVGFGIMDNLVMIQAGDMIDNSLGVAFGLSTLTAAGFGQCFSDVAGVTCGGVVDTVVSKLNLPQHGLTTSQRMLKKSRFAITIGGCMGVLTGCLIGMSCILFMDTDKADRMKKAQELTSIFKSVMEDGHHLIGAERATMWIYDKEKDQLWSKIATGESQEIRIQRSAGVAGACATSGEVINIPDAYADPRFNQQVDKTTGYRTKSIVAVPVKDQKGNVIGVIQMMNKSKGPFDDYDIKMLRMLSQHCATFMKIVEGDSK